MFCLSLAGFKNRHIYISQMPVAVGTRVTSRARTLVTQTDELRTFYFVYCPLSFCLDITCTVPVTPAHLLICHFGGKIVFSSLSELRFM